MPRSLSPSWQPACRSSSALAVRALRTSWSTGKFVVMKFAMLPLLTLLLTQWAASFAAAPDVQGKHLRVGFSAETGGIVAIVNEATGHNFVSSLAKKPKLWTLVFRTTDGQECELSNAVCGKPTIIARRGAAELFWKGLAVRGTKGSVDVRVQCRILKDDLAHLRIRVDNHSEASILRAVFPEINGVGSAGKSDVAFPKFNWGEMFRQLNHELVGYYPSADTPMQFCSLTDETNSLYLATHDPGAMHKQFRIKPGEVYSVETSVPDATVPGNNWHAPFDFVLGVHEGDWVRSCKLYRNWATREAPWTSRGRLATRKDVAPFVKAVGVWLNLADNFKQHEKKAMEFRKKMGVPVGVHWYNWHSNPFDKDYPDYLPEKPGFSEAVKGLHALEVRSMPYINGRLWDTQNRNYNSARPYATMKQSGEPTLEDYGSGTKLAVMCLGHPFWQTHLTRLIEQVVDQTGVDGIYIDQMAGADPAECFNKEHGHTLGRDTWWIEGYRKSVGAARRHYEKSRRPIFVASENNAEPYMDFVDLFLIWIPRSQNDIPMMTAVYSGYTQYFGSNRGSDSDMSFAMLQARDFTWGAQLFWEGAFILEPGQEEKLKVLGNLARLRYSARRYLAEGELVKVVEPLNGIPTVSGKWGSWTGSLETRTVPAVHAALWKAADGSYAVVLANAETRDQVFEFEFTPAQSSRKKWTVQSVTATGTESMGTVNMGDTRMRVTVPSRDGLVLQFN
jgi:hypothetical protein